VAVPAAALMIAVEAVSLRRFEDQPVAVHLCWHRPDVGANPPIRSSPYTTSLDATAELGEWTKDAAEEFGQAVALPRPGEPFEPAGTLPTDAWWRGGSVPIAHPWRRPKGPLAVPEASGDFDLAGER
jgi:hypothetical protein